MKRYMSKYILLLGCVAGMLSGCNKFLDITPKSVILPEKVADYEGILNSPTLCNTFPINLLDFADDNLNSLDALNITSTANGY
jgi:starch-binding outer membrane protein, SusD/RagB family